MWTRRFSSLGHPLDVQVRIRCTKSKVIFVSEPGLAIQDESRRDIQIGKSYLHVSIIAQKRCTFWEKRNLEARVGIEPTNKGFADPCLTTWLSRRRGNSYFCNIARLWGGSQSGAGTGNGINHLQVPGTCVPQRMVTVNMMGSFGSDLLRDGRESGH